MNDISHRSLVAKTDQGVIEYIGTFIRYHRLQLNKSQSQVSHDAGISRSTLSLLERGEDVRLSTLIQVLRVLGKLDVLDRFEVVERLSPLAIAKAQHSKRYRARPTTDPELNEPQSDW